MTGTITLPRAGAKPKAVSKPVAGAAAGLSASQQKTLQDLLTKATAGLTPAQKKQLQSMLAATSAPASTLSSADLNVGETGLPTYTPATQSIFKNPLTAAQKTQLGVLTQRKKAGTIGAAGAKELAKLTGIVTTAQQAWRDATPDALEGMLPGRAAMLKDLTAKNKAGTLGKAGKATLKALQAGAAARTSALTAYNATQKTAFDTAAATSVANAVAPGQELNRTYGSDLAQRAKWSILQRRGYDATVASESAPAALAINATRQRYTRFANFASANGTKGLPVAMRGHGDPGFGASVLRV